MAAWRRTDAGFAVPSSHAFWSQAHAFWSQVKEELWKELGAQGLLLAPMHTIGFHFSPRRTPVQPAL
jgi:hypothetical protein